jgi:hypothetical protein
MTIHAVLVEPPRPGLVLPDFPATTPLSASEAAELYAAMATDVLEAVERSGGEVLVNYRSEETIPDEYADGGGSDAEPDAEAAVRSLAKEALSDPDAARFEVQVGSTPAARAGNTVTHLLEEENADSVSILDPRAPTVARTDLDGAAMSLRRVETVLGPAPGGQLYYHGMTDPVDFTGIYDPPELSTVARRAVDAGHEIDFAGMHPVVTTGADLATLLVVLEARVAAGSPVPEATTEALFDLDLRASADGSRRGVDRA